MKKIFGWSDRVGEFGSICQETGFEWAAWFLGAVVTSGRKIGGQECPL
jgi:hypothetical protein